MKSIVTIMNLITCISGHNLLNFGGCQIALPLSSPSKTVLDSGFHFVDSGF